MIELNLIINDLSVVHQKNTIYHINDRDGVCQHSCHPI